MAVPLRVLLLVSSAAVCAIWRPDIFVVVAALMALHFTWCYCSTENRLGVKERIFSYVQTPMGRIHYRHLEVGKRSSSDVLAVFVAGIGSDLSYWPELLEAVQAAGIEVLAIDMPGRGASDCPHGIHDPALFSAFIRSVLEALPWAKARPIALIGMSFGGAVCAAASAPGVLGSNVVQTVCICPAGIKLQGLSTTVIGWVQKLPRPASDVLCLMVQVVSLFLFNLLPKLLAGSKPEGEEKPRWEAGLSERMARTQRYTFQDWLQNPVFFRAYLKTLRDFPLVGSQREALYGHMISKGNNALFIFAENDEQIATPDALGFIKETLPEARIELIEGAGHDLQWERPQQLSEIISKFVL